MRIHEPPEVAKLMGKQADLLAEINGLVGQLRDLRKKVFELTDRIAKTTKIRARITISVPGQATRWGQVLGIRNYKVWVLPDEASAHPDPQKMYFWFMINQIATLRVNEDMRIFIRLLEPPFWVDKDNMPYSEWRNYDDSYDVSAENPAW